MARRNNPDAQEAIARAWRSVNHELDRQEERLRRIHAALDPAILRERLRLSREESDLQQKTALAVTRQKSGLLAATARSTPLLPGLFGRLTSQAANRTSAGTPARTPAGPGAGGEADTGGSLNAALGGLGAAAGVAGAAVSLVASSLGALVLPAKELGGLASPVTLELFNRAIADTGATIGRVFVPVLELATRWVEMMGDVWATVLPSSEEVRGALSPLQEAFAQLRPILAEVAPLLRNVAQVGLKGLSYALAFLSGALKGIFSGLKQAGILSGDRELASSKGAAARPAKFQSLEEYAKSFYQSAYSGGGTTVDIPRSQLDRLEAIQNETARIFERTKEGVEGILQIVEIINKLPQVRLARWVFGSNKRGIDGFDGSTAGDVGGGW